jgi:hypothetical protein
VKRKPKRRGKVLQMLFEVVNSCMFRWSFNTITMYNMVYPEIRDSKYSIGE